MGTKLVNSKAEKKSRTWLATPPTWANTAIPGRISDEGGRANEHGNGRIPRHPLDGTVRNDGLEDLPRRPCQEVRRPHCLGSLRHRHRVACRHDKAPSESAGGQAE